MESTEGVQPPGVALAEQPPDATSAAALINLGEKVNFQVGGTAHLIHSLICELLGVFFCNNSDIQWPAGFFWEKNEPQTVLTMWSFL